MSENINEAVGDETAAAAMLPVAARRKQRL